MAPAIQVKQSPFWPVADRPGNYRQTPSFYLPQHSPNNAICSKIHMWTHIHDLSLPISLALSPPSHPSLPLSPSPLSLPPPPPSLSLLAPGQGAEAGVEGSIREGGAEWQRGAGAQVACLSDWVLTLLNGAWVVELCCHSHFTICVGAALE